MLDPEARARQIIDEKLQAAGWAVQDRPTANLGASRGVAIREFSMKSGYGEADYLLFVDRQAVGVIEAKKIGDTLTGVEIQTGRYGAGLPDNLTAPVRPLPFLYESTGEETRFTNQLDPDPKSRLLFHFQKPETLADWVKRDPTLIPTGKAAGEEPGAYDARATLRRTLRDLPNLPLPPAKLWPAQIEAVKNLEASLALDKPRALVQMATGSGKTVTAISSIYRLIKYGGAKRVLFLVDRGNLGRQTLQEFQNYETPDDGRKFTELYNVQHLQSNKIAPVARVVICTIQRLYSMLRGDEDLDPTLEEGSQFDTMAGLLPREPAPIEYNPAFPIETFDVIFTDEAHRSIYNLWRQVLEYFDAYLIGLTATPSKQTIGFFNKNLVMEYGHEKAVADGVNVGYDVYRIRTEITEQGATVDAGIHIDKRDRLTRKVRWEELDEEFTYTANQLDRDVVALDQIRTVIRTFRDKLFSDIFPGRTDVPKTLIFAKDDSHADDIVQIIRDEFGKGNEFCQKITYRTTGEKPENLLASFRTSYNPRIVVTVDMIATGTDIKPLEIVMFMRSVKSRNYFEQMKGRGVRVISPEDFQQVTRDARMKDHFVLIDCVGITENELTDAPPLEKKYSVAFEKLLQSVSFGSHDPDIVSSLAGRLARLNQQLGKAEKERIEADSGGLTLNDIVGGMIEALDPDRQIAAANLATGQSFDAEPDPAALADVQRQVLERALSPLTDNPKLRETILSLKKSHEQTIDRVTEDKVIDAGFTKDGRDRAAETVQSFREFIEANRDEISALQILYSRPWAKRLRFEDIRELAAAISTPPRSWTPDSLWQAYAQLEQGKVRGSGRRVLTDLVALVRHAIGEEPELVPFEDGVNARFDAWLAAQEAGGRLFTAEQRRCLEEIRDQIAQSFRIELDDFEYVPFAQSGGLGKVYALFGDELQPLLDELNEVLVA